MQGWRDSAWSSVKLKAPLFRSKKFFFFFLVKLQRFKSKATIQVDMRTLVQSDRLQGRKCSCCCMKGI